jgi:hypothetical protein
MSLVSEAHRLVGKPDYILERDGKLVPVERKSRKLSTAGAYEGEILQLGKGKGRYLKLVHLYPEKSRIPWVIPVPGYRTIFTKESLGRSSSVPVRLSGKETLLQLYETLSTPQTHPMCFRQIC